MKQKIQILFIPILYTTIGFCIIYNLLYGSLLYNFYPLDIREGISDILMVFLLAWIPGLIWMRPRIKLLVLKRTQDQYFGYQMLVACIIATVTAITASYVEKIVGKLTALQNITEIDTSPISKFYTIKHYYLAKEDRVIQYNSDFRGKYNQNQTLTIYIASPIYVEEMEPAEMGVINNDAQPLLNHKKKVDIFSPVKRDSQIVAQPQGIQKLSAANTKAWLCIHYEKRLKGIVYGDRKKQVETDFYNESLQRFKDTNLTSFTYLERVDNNMKRDRYQLAIRKADSLTTINSLFILEPKFELFKKRGQDKFLLITATLCIGSFLWFIIILFSKLDENKLNNFRRLK